MKRGEIWWAKRPMVPASKAGYGIPLVVIQSNDFNKSKINTVIAVVITTNLHLLEAPGNVPLSETVSRLPQQAVVNVAQIITVDKSLLIEKVHSLPSTIMDTIDEGIRLVLKL